MIQFSFLRLDFTTLNLKKIFYCGKNIQDEIYLFKKILSVQRSIIDNKQISKTYPVQLQFYNHLLVVPISPSPQPLATTLHFLIP